MEREQITVLGVGNILMKDEGFGVRVVEELQRRFRFPERVQVLDGGTLGMELLRFLKGTDKLIIVDAVSGGKSPGTLYQLVNEQVKAYFKEKVSMHELGIQDVLAALEILERPVRDLMVLGVQPAVIDVGLELSPEVESCVVPVLEKVLCQLGEWKAEVVLCE